MALARYQFTVVDDRGNVVPNASIEVRREGAGNSIVSLFEDRDGATPLGNPFNADPDGFAAFHVAGGAYRITATSGAFSREWRYVGIGRASESDALVTGLAWFFSDATADADPGPGNLRLNHATLASVTAAYVDNLMAAGVLMTAWLDSLDDGGSSGDRGVLTIMSADASAILVARVTGSVVDGTGYRKLSLTPLATGGAFTPDEQVNLVFGRAGVDGVIGGGTGSTDNAVLRADGTGGTTAQASSVTIDDSGNMGNVARLGLRDTNASHELRAVAGSDLTANRTLTVTTGDADRTLTLNADITPAGQGKQTVWVPAGAMKPRATSGAATGTFDSGSEDVTLGVLDFDQTTAEHAQFCIAMPKNWNESTITFQPYWTAGAGTAAQTLRFALSGIALSDDDALNAAQGTAGNSDDALIATGDVHIGPESSAITIGGTPAEGDLVVFNIMRDPNNDTLAADARLIGIKLFYTTNAPTDA